MMKIHWIVPWFLLGFRSGFRRYCSLTLPLLAGCAALGGCQEPTAAVSNGVEIFWQQ